MKLRHSLTFEALGTAWSIETAEPLSSSFKNRITQCINAFSARYSRFDPSSFVSVAARYGGTYRAPRGMSDLLWHYDKLYALSSGAINPLVGTSLEALGYDASYSFVAKEPISAPSYEHALHLKGRTVSIARGALLDVGAIGKGYLVDAVAQLVKAHHATYVIDGSGDMRVHTATTEPEIIGLEDPRDPSRVIGAVRLHDGALCASAPNRRAWQENLHHIIDARTGRPLETDIIATWAIASTTTVADALTTALFFV